MDVVSLVEKKRKGKILTDDEIEFLISSISSSQNIQDSQIGALLMAIRLNGMNADETIQLTKSMVRSGEVLTDIWPEEWRHLVVDKHSTGGVGDKVSLVLAPALAACGMKVPMISGRGLGHTGGTLDKMESIPGYKVEQTTVNIKRILDEVGCCIVGQTPDLVPADRIMYAMRDVTATVDSIPLVVGSIISKKAAEGLRALVLDIKLGKGAIADDDFMRKLARDLVDNGNGQGIETTGLLTKMDSPIGCMVGNALEVAESIECLAGHESMASKSLLELVTMLGGQLLFDSKQTKTADDGARLIKTKLNDGSALEKFRSMLKSQGVASDLADDLCREGTDARHVLSLLPKARHTTPVRAPKSGTINEIDAMVCATVCRELGAGRTKAGEKIDHAVGLEITKHVGQSVNEGDVVLLVHHNRPELDTETKDRLVKSISVGDDNDNVEQSIVVEYFYECASDPIHVANTIEQ